MGEDIMSNNLDSRVEAHRLGKPAGPIPLKDNIAVLTELIAYGGFGEVWKARRVNAVALLGEKIKAGEEDATLLGIDGVPYNRPVEEEVAAWTPVPITDKEHTKRIDDRVSEVWQKYLVKVNDDIKTAREELHNLLEVIDPLLLESPYIAVKVFKPRFSVEDEEGRKAYDNFVQRFRRENLLLQKLNHPGIVRRFGLVDDPQMGLCLLMQYVDGVTLQKLAESYKDQKVLPEDALLIAGQVGEALKYLHGKNIIHRDIKPQNIMVDKDVKAFLIDFGVSKWLDDPEQQQLTLPGLSLWGTPSYMAPEQLSADPKPSPKSDVYALATVLFEMLSGRKAYSGLPNEVILSVVERSHPTYLRELVPEISKELADLVEVGRAKNPDDRFGLDEFLIMVNELRRSGQYCAKEPVQVLTLEEAQNAIKQAEEARILAVIQQKCQKWRQHEAETRYNYLSIEKQISEAMQLLKNNALEQAQRLVDSVKVPSASRYDLLREQVSKLSSSIGSEIAYKKASDAVGYAQRAHIDGDQVELGKQLEQLKPLVENAEKTHPEIRRPYEELCSIFEPAKPFVSIINTVQNEFVVPVKDGISKLDKQGADSDSITKLLEKIDGGLTLLKSIEAHKDRIGHAYTQVINDLEKQRESLRQYTGA